MFLALLLVFLVLFQTLAEAEALAFEQQDMAAMYQPVKQRRSHAFMAKHLRPMRKVEIRGERDAGALIAIREELEEQLSRRLGEGQIAEFIHEDERVAPILR